MSKKQNSVTVCLKQKSTTNVYRKGWNTIWSERNIRVMCDTCSSTYDSFSGCKDTNQAIGCSAEVYNSTLIGFYGSRVADMCKYKIINKPAYVKNGIICDKCITKLQESHHLKLIGKGVW